MIGVLGKSKGIGLVMEYLQSSFLSPCDLKAIQKETKLSYERVYTPLAQLQQAGLVAFSKQKKSILAQVNPSSEIALHYCIIIEYALQEKMKREQPVAYQVMHEFAEELEKLKRKFVMVLVARKDNQYDTILAASSDNSFQKAWGEIRHRLQVKHSCHIDVKELEMTQLKKMMSESIKEPQKADAWRKKTVFHDIEDFWETAFAVLKTKAEKEREKIKEEETATEPAKSKEEKA